MSPSSASIEQCFNDMTNNSATCMTNNNIYNNISKPTHIKHHSSTECTFAEIHFMSYWAVLQGAYSITRSLLLEHISQGIYDFQFVSWRSHIPKTETYWPIGDIRYYLGQELN